MSFNNTYRQIIKQESASHAWIALHRLVEAYARTFGLRFGVVFAELESCFGFRRTVRSEWPALATMRTAAHFLRTRRNETLVQRSELIAARRRGKSRGLRVPVPPDLRSIERRLGGGEPVPRVGVWGWRIRRLHADGTSG